MSSATFTMPSTIRGLSCLILFVTACGSAEPMTPLMWTVKEDGAPPSHVLGTLHLGVSARDDLPSAVWDAFDQSSTLVVETDMRNIDPVAFREAASLPADQTLNQLISDDAWLALLALFPEAEPAALGKLKPWAARMEVFRLLYPQMEGMDLTFLNEADRKQKELVTLETWQEQIAPLQQIPPDDDARFLEELLDQKDAIVAAGQAFIARYKAGDLPALEETAVTAGIVPAPDDPLYASFIQQRNVAWMPSLEQALHRGGAFIAVGFGHLIYDAGLLAMLEDRGFSVRR